MYNLCKIYIITYIIYIIFGYDFITKLLNNKFPKNSILNKDILIKRFLQLSLITLLVNAIFFSSDFDITLFIIALLLNIIVCVGYYIKFYPISDPLTLLFHVLWAFPILFAPVFCKLTGRFNGEVVAIVITLLILYKFILEEYVYS